MSSAMYDTEFHVVPDIPTTKARLVEVLWVRLAAYRAFDKARAVSRSALGWVLSQLHRWVEATGGLGVLSWVSDHARDAVGLVRADGVMPTVVAVMSTPPIAAAAVRVAKFVGRGLVCIAKAAWTGTKSLLGRCGSTGTLITEILTHTGTQVADAVMSVTRHPMMTPVVHALKATVALVRPVSQGFVANRIVAALVPVLWLRAMIVFLVMPLLVDSVVLGTVWEWASTPTDSDPSNETHGTDEGDLLVNNLSLAIPMPGRTVPSDEEAKVVEQSDIAEQADDVEADEDQHLNRASRRTQQREHAHAWRLQHR
jgi:hypothetical protein